MKHEGGLPFSYKNYRLSTFKHSYLVTSLLLCANFLFAQQKPETDTADEDLFSINVLPVGFYSPETSLAFGAGAFSTFQFKGDKSTLSQSQVGVSYTLENQFLSFLSYRIFWSDDDWLSYGELGYYKYIYKYYGNGPYNTLDDEEDFSFLLPRVRINTMRQTLPGLYVGARYWFDGFDVFEVEEDGILDTANILGKEGGRASGIGPAINYDTRDNQLYPTKGWYAEASAIWNFKAIGSEYTFAKYAVDVVNYWAFYKNHILATNLYGELNTGEVPFHQMAQLGGERRMRGLYKGRFRDNTAWIFQAEYRWMFLPRWGGAAFGAFGNVAPGISEYDWSVTKQVFGGGVRFKISKDRKLNIRADVGYSPQGTFKYYITFGEAF